MHLIHSPLSFPKSNTTPPFRQITLPSMPIRIHHQHHSIFIHDCSSSLFTSASRHASATPFSFLFFLPNSILLRMVYPLPSHAHSYTLSLIKQNDSDTHLERRVICDTDDCGTRTGRKQRFKSREVLYERIRNKMELGRKKRKEKGVADACLGAEVKGGHWRGREEEQWWMERERCWRGTSRSIDGNVL